MTALTDTRLIVASDIVGNPEHFAHELTLLLEAHPDADLPSLRLVEEETVGLWRWLVRIGPITGERECPSCHTVAGHPHTDYCQEPDHCAAPEPHPPHIRFDGSNKVCPGVFVPEQRPDDDPAPVPTCDGRDCGGRPHE